MDLAEMLSTIWRSKWIILAVALITAGVVAVVTLRSDEVYEAEAVVMVGTLGTDSVFTRVDELAASYAELAYTAEVRGNAADKLGSSYESGGINVSAGEKSPFIRINSSNSSAEAAVLEANAVAEELVAYVSNLQQEDSKNKGEAVLRELSEIEKQQEELYNAPVVDEARAKALDTVRQSLIRQYEESKIDLFENSLNIVDPAVVAVKQESRAGLQIVIAFLLGAVMGVIIGFATESVRKALKQEN